MTESGWMNEETSLKWLQHFEKYRIPGPCVLILDSHVSHRSTSALTFCEEKSIHLICLPSHTTHRLQPLDRSFFKPLKAYYNEACNNFVHRTVGERKITKFNFGSIFKTAWCRSATLPKAVSYLVAFSLSMPILFKNTGFCLLYQKTHRVLYRQRQQYHQIAAQTRRFISYFLLLQKLQKCPVGVDRSKKLAP